MADYRGRFVSLSEHIQIGGNLYIAGAGIVHQVDDETIGAARDPFVGVALWLYRNGNVIPNGKIEVEANYTTGNPEILVEEDNPFPQTVNQIAPRWYAVHGDGDLHEEISPQISSNNVPPTDADFAAWRPDTSSSLGTREFLELSTSRVLDYIRVWWTPA